jgi:RNA polymerase sigma-70 factor (ECF subfamily)
LVPTSREKTPKIVDADPGGGVYLRTGDGAGAAGISGPVVKLNPLGPRPSLEESFEREAIPLMRQLYATAYRLTRNAADAEDLVQETYLRAFRAFAGYTLDTNIRAWLFTILYRVRTDGLRKAGRSPQTVELLDDGPGIPPPQDALAAGQEVVVRALNRLPEVLRIAVVLRDVQDFSYDEMAKILGVPIGTVMSRIHRGRAQLRRALSGGRCS